METQSKKDLEFDRVLDGYAAECLSADGAEALRALPLVRDRAELSRRQDIIGDFIRLISSGMVDLPVPFPDIREAENRLGDIRYTPDGAMLYAIGAYIRSAVLFCRFCQSTLEDKISLVHIQGLFGEGIDPGLRAFGEEVLDTLEADGSVKPTYPTIAALISRLESAKAGRLAFAHQYIAGHKSQASSGEGALRDGRLVIPMRSDRTGKNDGFVSGASASGATLFVEPFRLVELNNEVNLAQDQIQIETARILKKLSDGIKSLRAPLLSLCGQVGGADAYYALALAAHRGGMHRSEEGPCVRLLEARHPLLGSRAVPITIDLDKSVRAVVLTGPNAGGKTVTIKTVGLLVLINQLSGWIPAAEGSTLPLFDGVFTEIGDDQSIEEGLSTFSGHMKRIASILRAMDRNSLVILDELGSGTDPVEGSALARAILEECLRTGCLTLVTSHHGVLKEFAYARGDVMNASMAFDEESHNPTFRVVQGVPGDSHALDTALRQNVPKSVVDRAKSYLGSSAVQIGEVIKGLEEKRHELEEREEKLSALEKENQELRASLDEEKIALRRERMKIVDSQDTELARYVRNKNRELEHLLTELRGSGKMDAGKAEKAKSALQSMQKRQGETQSWLDREERSLAKVVPEMRYKVGDKVLLGSLHKEGIVTRVEKNNRYEVTVGAMRMTMKGSDMTPAPSKKETGPTYTVSYTGTTRKPEMEMDVRGLTLEETLRKMDLEIEACLVHGVTQFSVIHGYGDGILSRGIGEYLKHHPAVKDYRFAMPEDGGMGKTYVFL